jgi:hypothetical protein
MIEPDNELATIGADCKTKEALDALMTKHVLIVQHLVCRLARQSGLRPADIRNAYRNWSDLAVEQLKDPRAFPGGTCH